MKAAPRFRAGSPEAPAVACPNGTAVAGRDTAVRAAAATGPNAAEPCPAGTWRAHSAPRRRVAPAFAAAAGVLLAGAAAAAPVQATYEVRAAGLRIMDVEAAVELDAPAGSGNAPRAYSIEMRTRLRGVASVLGSGGGVSRATGTWRGTLARPTAFNSEGTWRGRERRVRIDYPGGQPVLRQLVPADDDEREPVPEAARRDTLDSLSVLAQLMRNVGETNRCEGSAAVYDGRRRIDFVAVTEGVQRLPPSGDSWAGEALRCRFTGNQTAGFPLDQPPAERRPQEGVAWMAPPRPGAPPIPVRVEVPSRWFGAITATLVGVSAPGAAGPGRSGSAGNGAAP